MNFLQLVQELVRMAGMAGEGGPPVIDGQKGEYRRAINFIQIAYEDVCNLHTDWDFLWATDTLEVEEGLDVYPAPDDLVIWDARRIFLDGEPLQVIEWDDYRPEELSPGRPFQAVIRPDNTLQLVPAPAMPCTLAFDYFRRPQPLTTGSQEPLIPGQFRRVILGRALILYALYEAAEDARLQGTDLYWVYLDRLERHQLGRRQQAQSRYAGAEIRVVAT